MYNTIKLSKEIIVNVVKIDDLTIFLEENGLDQRWDRNLFGSERSDDPWVGSDNLWASTIHDTTQKNT